MGLKSWIIFRGWAGVLGMATLAGFAPLKVIGGEDGDAMFKAGG